MLLLLTILSSTGGEGGSGTDTSGSSGSMESLKKIFTNPILYIVIGAIILLIIVIYLIRRFIKARPNASTIVVRRGQIRTIVDETNPKYFLVPFLDSIGAIITNDEKVLSSDKLFINNGPDALYKINYTLKYKVLDPKAFYPYINKLQEQLPVRLNDELRVFADQGNALLIVKDYRDNNDKILAIINKAVEEYHIEVTEFKINLIEPIGGR